MRLILFITLIIFTSNLNLLADTNIQRITVIAEKKYPEARDLSPQVSIITSDEIKKSGARNVAEILSRVVGAYVQSYGFLNSSSMVSIRGSSNEQVLVLINGKRLNSAQGGGVDFSSIDPDMIERIEIIRGGASALYGENALGGVINIITKSAGSCNENSVNYMFGSYNTHLLKLHSAGNLPGNFDYFFYGSILFSKGNFSFYDFKNKTSELRKNSDINSYDCGIKTGTYIDKFKTHRLSFSLLYRYDDKGVPGMIDFPTVSARMSDRRAIGQLDYTFNKFALYGKIDVSLYFNYQYRRFTDPDYFLGKVDDLHENKASGIDVKIFLNPDFYNIKNRIKCGYSYRYDSLYSTAFLKKSINNGNENITRHAHSFFIFDNINLFKFSRTEIYRVVLSPSMRFDINSIYDNVLSKQVGILINTDKEKKIVIKGNIGTAYRAPSFDDLFWPDTSFAVGNKNLMPEESLNFDIGVLSLLYTWLSSEIVLFYSEVTNLIQWNPGPGGQWFPSNIGKVCIKGIETEFKALLISNFLSGYIETIYNYSLTFVTDKSGEPATDGKQLPRRPFEKANFIMSFNIPDCFYFHWETRFVGFRYLTAHNTKYLDSYFTHNINIGYEISKNFSISLIIRNLFNSYYIDIREYPIPGRELMFRIGVEF